MVYLPVVLVLVLISYGFMLKVNLSCDDVLLGVAAYIFWIFWTFWDMLGFEFDTMLEFEGSFGYFIDECIAGIGLIGRDYWFKYA